MWHPIEQCAAVSVVIRRCDPNSDSPRGTLPVLVPHQGSVMLPTRMRTTVEPLEGNKVKLSVEVDEAEIEPAIEDAFKQLAREVRIPGFRPGKVPRGCSRRGSVSPTPGSRRCRTSSPAITCGPSGRRTSTPSPSLRSTSLAGEESGDISFEATVEVRPTIEVEGYGGIQVTFPSPDRQRRGRRPGDGPPAVVGRGAA